MEWQLAIGFPLSTSIIIVMQAVVGIVRYQIKVKDARIFVFDSRTFIILLISNFVNYRNQTLDDCQLDTCPQVTWHSGEFVSIT